MLKYKRGRKSEVKMEITGDMIKTARRSAGLTLQELSAIVCVSQPAISQWESGKTKPSPKALQRLIAALPDLRAYPAPKRDSHATIRAILEDPNFSDKKKLELIQNVVS